MSIFGIRVGVADDVRGRVSMLQTTAATAAGRRSKQIFTIDTQTVAASSARISSRIGHRAARRGL